MNKIYKPLSVTAIAGLIATSLVASSPAGGSTSDVENITLQVGDQIAGTEKILSAAGELDDLPYDITWSTFTSGPPQIEALNAGQIDFAITGNTPPIVGGLTDTKVVSAYSNETKGDAIFIPEDSDITSVADLKGKSVAVARGSSAHGHLVLQLEKAGVNVEDLNINFLQPSDSKSAFESGQVDAWAVWDPYTAIAEVSGAVPLITAGGLSNGYGFGVASDQALADDTRAEAIDDPLNRIDHGYQWTKDNPEEWAKIFAEETGADAEAAEINVRSSRLPIPLDQTVIDSQNDLIGAFERAEVLPETFDFADQIDVRFED
ncbi:MAG: ABC transporter substrate-binding protein [Corynebacterium casei]|uniref:ABC transporter substrate-binding protein n=1 Tax=Corynebacterium casei TaxID=160386 RepID=UPI002649DD74|nr:ABC transporter substrate-binding protein [Corynebacterium casei]MDN5800795.1 ABC transporter substrate-binding protein [Corynebacterium casei]